MEYNECVTLLAKIVEQARKDARGIDLTPPHTCSQDYPHSPRKCAREFLAALDTTIDTTSRMSVSEMGETILEIIG